MIDRLFLCEGGGELKIIIYDPLGQLDLPTDDGAVAVVI